MPLNPIKNMVMLLIAIIMTCSSLILNAKIIKVPADFNSIALAVQNANAGDTIILSPGTYNEMNIIINKSMTISSEWILNGDESLIDQTTVNSSGAILFTINSDDVEISGLKIINGDHTLDINARATVKYNHMENNLDPVSMETGGGGYVGYNTMMNNTDDGIDLDIGIGGSYTGSDILIEYNTIINSKDDGIEIRLFNDPNQNIHYEIRHNTITGSKRAGIQIISYDVYTGKVFDIHHNLIKNCKAGLGCMGGSNTTEDLGGAPLMDEKVFLYNNTFLENEMGATGGNSMIAINNVVADNTIGGFKLFGDKSAIANNLFYNNNNNDLVEINGAVQPYGNIFASDPLLNEVTFFPGDESPCIDAGLVNFILDEIIVIEIHDQEYKGIAPDIGAKERGMEAGIGPYSFASDQFDIINVPNPFRLSTDIVINVPLTGIVRVDIFDMTGRHIQTLADDMMNKGIQTIRWNPAEVRGNDIPQGVYFARLRAGTSSITAKMLFLR